MASCTQMALQLPVKEQAIVLDYVNGISVEEYVTAIGQIIGPKNIEFVSPISNDFVYIFLNSKEMVNKLININTVINIGTHVLKIRPLIPRSIRIILSNVCPIIPPFIIEKELAKLNVQPISQIMFIKQNIDDPNYAHICGSDREMYIQLEDGSKLPEILEINYDDTNYSILLIMDEITCKEEHTNENSKIETPTENILNIKDEKNNEKDTMNTQIKKIHEDVPVRNSTWIPQPSTSKATEIIPYPKIFTESLSTSLFTHNFKKGSEMKKERTKRSKPSKKDIFQHLQPAKNFIIANMKRYHLNFQSIIELIFNTYSYSNFVLIARSYTKDIPALIDLLLNIKEFISNRPLKNQIARIIRGLIMTTN
ncbi:uncharacterized protein LOC118448171 isoform X2 [Vespa mandarinia]|uniref:uncharacterized protein LOC118448171 isoform X2 n=1 Tax=Vespa mandarinia TaxID=7446 RepID=UPI00160E8643|nr:uncharacterized protein LOC118448171 isoform X2 [Vespa mandarinia]